MEIVEGKSECDLDIIKPSDELVMKKRRKKVEEKEEDEDGSVIDSVSTVDDCEENSAEKEKLIEDIKCLMMNNNIGISDLDLKKVLEFKKLGKYSLDRLKGIKDAIYYKMSGGLDIAVIDALLNGYSVLFSCALKIRYEILQKKLNDDKPLKESLKVVLGRVLCYCSPWLRAAGFLINDTVQAKVVSSVLDKKSVDNNIGGNESKSSV